jgi:hypothetical protein
MSAPITRSPKIGMQHNVARLKAMLPASSYLHLLHQGTMTGFLPRFDPEGKPTGQFDNLAPKDRVDLARYLLDKVIPDAPKELALTMPTPEKLDAVTVAHLSSDELRRIAATPVDAVPEPELAVPLAAGTDSEGTGPA